MSKTYRKERKRVIHPATGPGKTQQHFKDEVNINNIVAKFKKTGRLDGARNTAPQFGDFTSNDFMDIQNLVTDVQTNFMSLSARLRAKFNHSPYQLIRWLENPANKDEAIRLGLLEEKGSKDPYLTNEEVQQMDLAKQAEQAQEASRRADPEAQPSHGRKAGKTAETAE